MLVLSSLEKGCDISISILTLISLSNIIALTSLVDLFGTPISISVYYIRLSFLNYSNVGTWKLNKQINGGSQFDTRHISPTPSNYTNLSTSCLWKWYSLSNSSTYDLRRYISYISFHNFLHHSLKLLQEDYQFDCIILNFVMREMVSTLNGNKCTIFV